MGSGGALRLDTANALGAAGAPLTLKAGATVDLKGNAQRTLMGKGLVTGAVALSGTIAPGPGIATLNTETLAFIPPTERFALQRRDGASSRWDVASF